MKWFVAAGAIVVSAVTGAPSRATNAAAPVHADRAVPFVVGETLTYDVSWSLYLTAGTAVTTVKDKRSSDGSSAYEIAAQGRTTPLLQHLYTLSYKLDTLLDSASLLPLRASTETQEGSRHRVRTTTFDRRAGKARYEISTTTIVKEEVVIAPQTQDALSAIYALRAAPIRTGARITMPVTDGGTMYTARFDVGAPERVRVPAGEMNAWNIAVQIADANGAPVGRHVAIWIAEDAKRWPVKLQAELAVGSFTLALRDAR
jgi:uncharacterized protein DUF3108